MADPYDVLRLAVQKQFPKLGKIRKKCTYKSMGDSTVNADRSVSREVRSTEAVSIVFAEFNSTINQSGTALVPDQQILKIDRQAIFPVLDLVAVPEIGDIITDQEGKTWAVVGLNEDPAPAAYALHVRPDEN